jgi:mannose-1-phosphate guanylyltransferase
MEREDSSKTIVRSESVYQAEEGKASDVLVHVAKTWGSYTVLHEEAESLTILVKLTTGNRMRYHAHAGRRELWVVSSGSGRVVINETERYVKTGDVVELLPGQRHTIIASTDLSLIEIQLGDTNAADKKVYDLRQDFYDDGSTGFSLG